jgi:mRNA interferase MazF
VAALTRTRRELVSELELTAAEDRLPSDCFVNFDNIHTLPRTALRRRITRLSPGRLHHACRTLRASTGC